MKQLWLHLVVELNLDIIHFLSRFLLVGTYQLPVFWIIGTTFNGWLLLSFPMGKSDQQAFRKVIYVRQAYRANKGNLKGSVLSKS